MTEDLVWFLPQICFYFQNLIKSKLDITIIIDLKKQPVALENK